MKTAAGKKKKYQEHFFNLSDFFRPGLQPAENDKGDSG